MKHAKKVRCSIIQGFRRRHRQWPRVTAQIEIKKIFTLTSTRIYTLSFRFSADICTAGPWLIHDQFMLARPTEGEETTRPHGHDDWGNLHRVTTPYCVSSSMFVKNAEIWGQFSFLFPHLPRFGHASIFVQLETVKLCKIKPSHSRVMSEICDA